MSCRRCFPFRDLAASRLFGIELFSRDGAKVAKKYNSFQAMVR